MDFVVGLPRTRRGHDVIWVIIDRLTKSAHFLAIRRTDPLDRLADLYCREIIRLHGVPLSIISDRDPRFTSRFWQSLQQALGTQLRFSTAFHPQTDGPLERTFPTLEDLLRSCVLDFRRQLGGPFAIGKVRLQQWFAFDDPNATVEVLYGRPCRTPIF